MRVYLLKQEELDGEDYVLGVFSTEEYAERCAVHFKGRITGTYVEERVIDRMLTDPVWYISISLSGKVAFCYLVDEEVTVPGLSNNKAYLVMRVSAIDKESAIKIARKKLDERKDELRGRSTA